MSFLAPLFVLGALAIAAPILFHLIRRTSKEKTLFSSLMFLQPTPPRVTRKSRLENILLLILRCAVLCLLALAFTRPFFKNPLNASPTKGAVTRTVILIDTSASMRRDNLWNDAVDKALDIARKADSAAQIAILAFDRSASTVLPFRDWTRASSGERKTLAEQRLRVLKPTWNNTQLGNALIAANEALDAEREFATADRRIIIVSDMQEGARLDGLQGLQWPKQTQVTLAQVKPKRAGNAGAQLLAQAANTVQTVETVRIRVHNAGDSKREQFELRWNNSISNPISLYVPAGQNRMLDVPRVVGSDTLTLSGDETDFDNNLNIITPPREQIDVAFIGSDEETNTANLLFYLKRAFPETARQIVHIKPVKPDGDLAGTMRNASLVVLGTALPAGALREVAAALTNGATLLCALRTPVEADTIAQLTGYNVTAEEATGGGYQMLSEIEFSHPLFASFADARFSDFTKIHFWKHRKVNFGTTNAHLLARFDNGDPAVAQFITGKGTLFVLAAGWHPGDSQLALSSKFVPLLYSLLEIGGAMKAQSLAFTVGENVDLSQLHATNVLSVRLPDGTTVAVAARTRFFPGTSLPGVYTIEGTEPAFRFAVNIAGEESKTAPLAIEQLEQLGVPVKAQAVGTVEQIARREQQLKATELENHQKLWRWIIVATLIVLIAETWVAARLSRRAPAAA